MTLPPEILGMHAAAGGRRKSFMGIEPFRSKLDKIKIILFQGNEFSNQRSYELDESLKLFASSGGSRSGNEHFDMQRKTMLYIHGYADESKHDSVRAIVDAYLQRNDYNILVLDWADLASGNYLIDAVPNAKQLATKVSETILDWVDEGLDVEKFHVIGHSLGAQVAALIGRCIIRKSNGETKLNKITALDPPPLFPLGARINEKDAECVDIIHTEQRYHSTPKSPGTLNFWPQYNDSELNGRAWLLWAESVQPDDNKLVFLSVRAKGYNEFKKGNTDDADIVTMGIDCRTSAKKGDYFLLINDAAPHAKGIKGLKYERSRSNSLVGSFDIILTRRKSRSNSLAIPSQSRGVFAS